MHSPDPIPVMVKRLPHFAGLTLPAYATGGAAGMDVLAAEDVTLAPGERWPVATGLAVAIPHGYEIQVRPRWFWPKTPTFSPASPPGASAPGWWWVSLPKPKT